MSYDDYGGPGIDPDLPGFGDALGRTIRVLRIEQRIDRKELAQRADISYSYLSAIENGYKPPSTRVLYRIAEALGVPGDELLSATRERMETQSIIESMPPQQSAAAPAAPPPPAEAAQSRSWFRSARPQARRTAMGSSAAANYGKYLADEPDSARSPAPQSGDPSAEELLTLLDLMSPDDRRRVIDLARRLAQG